jgi:hypothetical protein
VELDLHGFSYEQVPALQFLGQDAGIFQQDIMTQVNECPVTIYTVHFSGNSSNFALLTNIIIKGDVTKEEENGTA